MYFSIVASANYIANGEETCAIALRDIARTNSQVKIHCAKPRQMLKKSVLEHPVQNAGKNHCVGEEAAEHCRQLAWSPPFSPPKGTSTASGPGTGLQRGATQEDFILNSPPRLWNTAPSNAQTLSQKLGAIHCANAGLVVKLLRQLCAEAISV